MFSRIAPLKTLSTKLDSHLFIAWSFSYVVLLLFLYLLVPKVFVFFFPLLFSTAVCSLAIYLFIMSERQSAGEVVLDEGREKPEVRLLQVYDEVNFSIYNNHIEVGCFLIKPENGWMKSEKDADNTIVFAGRLKAEHHYGVFDEDVACMKIDNLAEGAWNYYFGRCSKWNRRRAILDEENDLMLM